MKVKLETVANWIIVITGVTVTALFASRLIAEHQQPTRPPQGYQIGEKVIAAESPVDFSKAPQTLVLFLSSQCHFCTESVPFYHDLLKAREAAGSQQTRMVAISVEDSPTLQGYLKQHELAFDEVVSVPREKIKMRGTPTLVLLDQSGTVKGVWNGYLTSVQRRSEVIKLVTAGRV